MKPKVLVISPGLLPLPPFLGGAVENLIFNLHGRLHDQFDFEYVSVRPPTSSISHRYDMPSALIHYLDSTDPLEEFDVNNNFELSESSKWQEYVRFCSALVANGNYQVVHIHNEANLVEPLRQQAPSTKILLHINSEVVMRMSQEALSRLSGSVDLIANCSAFIQRSIDEAFRDASLVTPASCVLYNFVDTKMYDPLRFSAQDKQNLRSSLGLENAPVILFVGRLIEQKGPHLALRAFRRVRNEVPDAKMLFVGAPWYGRNDSSVFLRSLYNEAKDLSDSILFTGYVDQIDMPKYYAIGDALVVPSIWDDPSPFVAYEGQAMELPVVSSRRGGIPEIVSHGVTGYCIDVYNTQLFADRLTGLCNDSSARQTMGKKGRARISQHFDLSIAAKLMAETYWNVWDSSGRSQ